MCFNVLFNVASSQKVIKKLQNRLFL